jgi:hypothetical protein
MFNYWISPIYFRVEIYKVMYGVYFMSDRAV